MASIPTNSTTPSPKPPDNFAEQRQDLSVCLTYPAPDRSAHHQPRNLIPFSLFPAAPIPAGSQYHVSSEEDGRYMADRLYVGDKQSDAYIVTGGTIRIRPFRKIDIVLLRRLCARPELSD